MKIQVTLFACKRENCVGAKGDTKSVLALVALLALAAIAFAAVAK